MAFTISRPSATVIDFSVPDGDERNTAVAKNSTAINYIFTTLNSAGLGVGDLVSTNNLSDLGSADTALDNLGLSTFGKSVAVASNAGACRTLLELGDAALKTVGTSSGNVPVLDAGGKLATGVIPDGGYLVAANNLSDLSNAGTALDNLGMSTFVQSTISASNASGFRYSLDLGDAALKTVGSSAGNLVQLDAGGKFPQSTIPSVGEWIQETVIDVATETPATTIEFVGLDMVNYDWRLRFHGLRGAGTALMTFQMGYGATPTWVVGWVNSGSAFPGGVTNETIASLQNSVTSTADGEIIVVIPDNGVTAYPTLFFDVVSVSSGNLLRVDTSGRFVGSTQPTAMRLSAGTNIVDGMVVLEKRERTLPA